MNQSKKLLKGRKTFAVVVDGETEYWYLNMLKRNERSLKVNIEPKIPQKKSISEQYRKVVELSGDYTKVIWIVDLDVLIHESRIFKAGFETPIQEYAKYRDKLASNSKVITLVNNPCLEFWFLIHFERTKKYYSKCYSVEEQLKKHVKDYKKNRKYYVQKNNDIYKRLKSRIDTAISNGKFAGEFDLTKINNGISEMYYLYDIMGIRISE